MQLHCLHAGVSMCVLSMGMLPSAHAAAEPARIEIGEGVAVNPGIFAANGTHLTPENLISNPNYATLIRALGITGLRYGDGSNASFWDWKAGKYVSKDEITAIWAGEGNWMLESVDGVNALPEGMLSPLKFDAFANQTDIAMQWVLNMTTRPEIQAAFFTFLHDHDVPVKYVEMDNETYFWSNEFGIDADSGRRYGERVVELTPHIRELYPDVRIGIVAAEDDFFVAHHAAVGTQDDRFKFWNQKITAEEIRPSYDAFILHHYVMGKDRLNGYDNDADRARAFLAYPQVTLERGAALILERYGAIPMWITEFNVICYYEPMAGQGESNEWIRQTKFTHWAALYQAGFWLTAMSRPDAIEILNHHSVSNVDIGWGLGLPVSDTEIEITAQGQLFAHLAHLAQTHDTMHPLTFDGNPALGIVIEDVADAKALHGAALRNAEGTTLLMMNRGLEPIEVALTPRGGTTVVSVVYASAETKPAQTARVKLDGDAAVWEQGPLQPVRSTHEVDGDVKATLPPSSLTVLTVTGP